MPTITPNPWFDAQGEGAAAFYCSIFPDSRMMGMTKLDVAALRAAADGEV